MKIKDLKLLADDEYIEEEMTIQIQKQMKTIQGKNGPFWSGKARDETGECEITVFNSCGTDIGGKTITVGGKGLQKSSWTNNKSNVTVTKLIIGQKTTVDYVQGAPPDAHKGADTSNMTPVSGQHDDGKSFHLQMRMMSLFMLHCLDYRDLIAEKYDREIAPDTFQNILTSLWMTGKEYGLTNCKAPRTVALPKRQDPPPQAAGGDPSIPDDPPAQAELPGHQQDREAEYAKAEKELAEANKKEAPPDDIEEEDLSF